MLRARDAGELVGISHEKRVETSIVDFLYLYFSLQTSPIESDAQHFHSHNSSVFGCRRGNPAKFVLSRRDGLVFNGPDFDWVVQSFRDRSMRVRNGERDSGFICLKKYCGERRAPGREHQGIDRVAVEIEAAAVVAVGIRIRNHETLSHS